MAGINWRRSIDFAVKLAKIQKGDLEEVHRVMASNLEPKAIYERIMEIAEDGFKRSSIAYDIEFFKRHPTPHYFGGTWDDPFVEPFDYSKIPDYRGELAKKYCGKS